MCKASPLGIFGITARALEIASSEPNKNGGEPTERSLALDGVEDAVDVEQSLRMLNRLLDCLLI